MTTPATTDEPARDGVTVWLHPEGECPAALIARLLQFLDDDGDRRVHQTRLQRYAPTYRDAHVWEVFIPAPGRAEPEPLPVSVRRRGESADRRSRARRRRRFAAGTRRSEITAWQAHQQYPPGTIGGFPWPFVKVIPVPGGAWQNDWVPADLDVGVKSKFDPDSATAFDEMVLRAFEVPLLPPGLDTMEVVEVPVDPRATGGVCLPMSEYADDPSPPTRPAPEPDG